MLPRSCDTRNQRNAIEPGPMPGPGDPALIGRALRTVVDLGPGERTSGSIAT